MKNKNNVVNLQLSKKLVKAGIIINSEFYWDSHAIEKTNGYGLTNDGEYPAPLATELLKLIPFISKLPQKVERNKDGYSYEGFKALTLPDAIAKFLLELKTINLI